MPKMWIPMAYKIKAKKSDMPFMQPENQKYDVTKPSQAVRTTEKKA